MKIGVSDPGQCPTLWSDRWLVLGETVEIEQQKCGDKTSPGVSIT